MTNRAIGWVALALFLSGVTIGLIGCANRQGCSSCSNGSCSNGSCSAPSYAGAGSSYAAPSYGGSGTTQPYTQQPQPYTQPYTGPSGGSGTR